MQKTPRIELIAAVAANGVIGGDNRMLWHIPEDFKHFKATTMGHPVVMGRKTRESIGRALPGRRNVVVTRSADYVAEGAEIVHSLAAAYALCADADSVFVIGGAQIYEQAIADADVLWLTEIDTVVEGDAYFPSIDEKDWTRTLLSRLEPTAERPFAVTFWRLARNR